MEIDGTYSMVASGVKGCSSAVVSIRDGKLEGWDSSGSRYEGTYSIVDGSDVDFDVKMTLPPNHFLIWGASPVPAWQTREIKALAAVTPSNRPAAFYGKRAVVDRLQSSSRRGICSPRRPGRLPLIRGECP